MRSIDVSKRSEYNRQEKAFSDGLAFTRYFYDEQDAGRDWMHETLDSFMDLMDKSRRFPVEQVEVAS